MMRILAVFSCLLVLITTGHAAPRRVVVIAMENKDAFQSDGSGGEYIYGNVSEAPYINEVLWNQAARASNFVDELSEEKSGPHYILLEAGRTEFEDTRFECDRDPLESCNRFFGRQNWTQSRDHLTAQIESAHDPELSWMTYQEGIEDKTTGACPIHSAGLYAAKHNPFVYFSDVAGAPPDANDPHCIAHTRDLSRFAADMQSGSLANFVFITPNLCNDMHGAHKCKKNHVANGDRFLESFLPPLLSWARQNETVVFVVWDECTPGRTLPFFAAGWGVKAGHESGVQYSHRSVLRTIERIFDLPVLDSVKDAADLSDMFEPGALDAAASSSSAVRSGLLEQHH